MIQASVFHHPLLHCLAYRCFLTIYALASGAGSAAVSALGASAAGSAEAAGASAAGSASEDVQRVWS